MTSATAMTITDLLADVAAVGLPGVADREIESPLDDRRWRSLLVSVADQRLSGFLMETISLAEMAVTPEQLAEAVSLHREAMSLALVLDRTLLEVVGCFAEHGIATRVLKGSAHAHLLYPDPALRSFGDIDLLVRGADLPKAVELLVAAGGRRRHPEPRRGFDRRFTKGACVVTAPGYEIDLHRTFASGRFGLQMDPEALFERSEAYDLGGCTLEALAAEERFLHACYHAVLGSAQPRLSALRDVAQMAIAGRFDSDRVLSIAERWGGECVVAKAVLAASTTLSVDAGPIGSWAAGRRETDSEQRVLAGYMGDTRNSAVQALAGITAVPNTRARLDYLLALVLPTSTSSEGRLRRWRRGWRALVGGRHR